MPTQDEIADKMVEEAVKVLETVFGVEVSDEQRAELRAQWLRSADGKS